jgi:hypothetical protein
MRRKTSRKTLLVQRAKHGGMPPMLDEAKSAYNADALREAMRAFIERHNLVIRPWAEKAGVSPGAVYNFLRIADPDAPRPEPGVKPPKPPTKAPKIDFFYRLAWAGGGTLSELIGETPPGIGPLPGTAVFDEPVRQEIEHHPLYLELQNRYQMQMGISEQLYRRIAELEKAKKA